jgi:hypothetical protein
MCTPTTPARDATMSVTLPHGVLLDDIFYGPHACSACGVLIVKQQTERGGRMFLREGLRVGDYDIYPNNRPDLPWREHACGLTPAEIAQGNLGNVPVNLQEAAAPAKVPAPTPQKMSDKFSPDEIQRIAFMCHEVNRAYCHTLGDDSQVAWGEAPEWQKTSALNGVRFHLDNPGADPAESHDNWMEEKLRNGWKYGAVKNPEAKEHPCLLPYRALSKEERFKDILFKHTIGMMLVLLRSRAETMEEIAGIASMVLGAGAFTSPRRPR